MEAIECIDPHDIQQLFNKLGECFNVDKKITWNIVYPSILKKDVSFYIDIMIKVYILGYLISVSFSIGFGQF